MKFSVKKIIPFLLMILIGYGIAHYQASRFKLSDEINDFQREISIASRLLTEYVDSCNNEYSGFYGYVLHSIEKYELLIGKAKSFPYYFGKNFLDDHDEILFSFSDDLQEIKKRNIGCNNSE